jgi:hypothetical protein
VSEQISDERLREYLAFSESEEDAEMVSILVELSERRKISRELRAIYAEQDSNLFYTRRNAEYWKKKYDEDGA